MKVFATAAKAALVAGEARTSGAVKIDVDGAPLLAWGGAGTLTIDGEAYTGIGDRGLISVSGGQMGASEDGVELSVSSIEPTLLDLDTTLAAKNARTTIWRLMFDVSGEILLDAQAYDRGRLDKLSWNDTPGGTGVLTASVETAARGLGRMTGRLTSDADQRMIDPNDNSCSLVTQAGQLTMAWGGKPPARASSALPGGLPAGTVHFNVGGVGLSVNL